MIAKADSKDKRREDLGNYHKWRSKVLDYTNQRGQGAVSEILG